MKMNSFMTHNISSHDTYVFNLDNNVPKNKFIKSFKPKLIVHVKTIKKSNFF